MMGFTKDGQIDPELVKKRDEMLKISTGEKRKKREALKCRKSWKALTHGNAENSGNSNLETNPTMTRRIKITSSSLLRNSNGPDIFIRGQASNSVANYGKNISVVGKGDITSS